MAVQGVNISGYTEYPCTKTGLQCKKCAWYTSKNRRLSPDSLYKQVIYVGTCKRCGEVFVE